MRRLAYTASPYNSGPLTLEVNKVNARTLARYAYKVGYNPISPIENYAHLDLLVSVGGKARVIQEREILEMCLNLLMVCDVLILGPNWRDSVGCRIEYLFAQAKGMRIQMPLEGDFSELGLHWILEGGQPVPEEGQETTTDGPPDAAA